MLMDDYASYWDEIEHTADVAVDVRGESLAHLFKHAAAATITLMGDNLGELGESVTTGVELSAPDVETLLVDWLTELLFYAEEGILMVDITMHVVEDNKLHAVLHGRRGAHFSNHIKAVTFNELAIRETEHGFSTRIVYDV